MYASALINRQAQQPVAIAGGGIAGLASALSLARYGIPSVVFEQSSRFSELGAGLQLGPNALWVLEQLGLLDEALAAACQPQALHVRDIGSGKTYQRLFLGSAFAQRHGKPYITLHRAYLHKILLRAARQNPLIELRCQSKVLGFTQNPYSDSIELEISEAGGDHTAAALLICDGIWSGLRQQLLPHAAPARYSGHTAYRALVPATAWPQVKQLNLNHELGLWWGRRAHILHYPVQNGELLNIVALIERPAPPSESMGWSTPIAQDAVSEVLLAATGKDCTPDLQAVLGSAQNWFTWPMYARAPARGWSQGLVTLVGDAARTMLPYMAQGAAMALEDALVLAGCLGDSGDWNAVAARRSAFLRYEALRFKRSSRVVATAARNGRIFHMSGLCCSPQRLFICPWRKPLRYADWLYGWQRINTCTLKTPFLRVFFAILWRQARLRSYLFNSDKAEFRSTQRRRRLHATRAPAWVKRG